MPPPSPKKAAHLSRNYKRRRSNYIKIAKLRRLLIIGGEIALALFELALYNPCKRFSASMKDKFDYHDIFSVVIPGIFALLIYFLYTYESLDSFFDRFLSISLGSSAIMCVASYVAGEFIQALGKIVEIIFWWIFGKHPTYWITSTPRNKYYQNIRAIPLVSEDAIVAIKESLNIPSSITDEDIDRNFHKLKAKAIKNELYNSTILTQLAKANMFRGFLSIFLFSFAYCIICTNHQISVILLHILLIIVTSFRYRYFSIKYSKHIFECFAEEYKKEHPEAPKRALGVE